MLPGRRGVMRWRVVDAPQHAVDPAEAEQLVHRLGIGEPALARALLVEPQQKFCGGGVMGREPAPESGAGGEVSGGWANRGQSGWWWIPLRLVR